MVQNIAKYYNVPQPDIYYDDLDEEERNLPIHNAEEKMETKFENE